MKSRRMYFKNILIDDLKRIIDKIEEDKLLKFYLDVDELDEIYEKTISYLDEDIDAECIVHILYLNAIIRYIKKEWELAYYILLDILKYINSIDLNKNKHIITKTYIYLTICSISIKKNSNIEYFYKKAKTLIDKYNLLDLLVFLNMSICIEIRLIYEAKPIIIELIEEVKDIKDVLDNDALVCRSIYTFGKIYIELFNNFIESIEYLTRGIKIAQDNNYDVLETSYECVISTCYIESENNIEAIIYLEDILNNEEKTKHLGIADKVNLEIDLVGACIKEELYEKVNEYLDNVLNEIEKIDDVYKEQLYSYVYIYLADIELKSESFDSDKIKNYLNLAEEIYNKYGSTFMYSSELHYIYKIFGNLYIKSNEIDKGIKFYYKGLNLIVKTTLNNNKIAEFYKLIADAYEAKGEFEKAIKYYKYMDKYIDKWQKDSTYKLSQNIHKNYEFKKKEDSLKKLEKSTKELEKDILVDSLTKLYNRRYLEEYINDVKNLSDKDMTSILIDIDYFKTYNDNYGHIKGDRKSVV